MCKFIGKSNEQILCNLSKSEILRFYSIVHVAMETTKTSHFTHQSKSFISIFFTCQVSSCELRPFSCHDLANGIYSQTTKTVFSHLNWFATSFVRKRMKNCPPQGNLSRSVRCSKNFYLHKIYPVQIWCKKVQTTVNVRAKMYVNTALALEYSTVCKLECKCGI